MLQWKTKISLINHSIVKCLARFASNRKFLGKNVGKDTKLVVFKFILTVSGACGYGILLMDRFVVAQKRLSCQFRINRPWLMRSRGSTTARPEILKAPWYRGAIRTVHIIRCSLLLTLDFFLHAIGWQFEYNLIFKTKFNSSRLIHLDTWFILKIFSRQKDKLQQKTANLN